MYAAIFVDIDGPLHVLSLGLQADKNDLVKPCEKLKNLTWSEGSTSVQAPVSHFTHAVLAYQGKPTYQGDESVMKLAQHFTAILKKATCNMYKDTMLTEWSSLNLFISESYGKMVPYCDVCAAIFSLPVHSSKFSNILNIIE